MSESVPATCFPTAAGLASSWDNNLIHQVGEYLGEECLTEKVSVLLGPGANIKRHPLCGRNFEYFSEDPFLTGHLAKSLIKGIQSKNVGTSLKHFVANNQETMRMVVDTFIDERTLREIYLKGFEIAVKEAQPWTIMCSYNKVNGTYLSENKKLLQDILKDEWKHQGLVITDWGACNDRVKGLIAGQDLEMPGPALGSPKKIIKAVNDGVLSTDILDKRAERVLDLILKSADILKQEQPVYDKEEHHKFARKASADTMVLLKNDNDILPLKKEQSIALVGEFAVKPRYQGSGSSLINPTKISKALDAFKDMIGEKVSYAKGYDSTKDIIDNSLVKEAVDLAATKDIVVLMIGLTDSFESEGFDRTHLNIPKNHLILIEEIKKVNKNIVVCLSNGSPIAMPWKDEVKAILEQYLGGQASGEALVDVLYGKVNPSGKLAETFPNSVDEFPSNQNFPGSSKQVEYREGLFVGYRYYDTADVSPLYPFGYGLSYTKFKYDNFVVSNKSEISVKFTIQNIGKVFGKETAQVYISKTDSNIYRPMKELKGYQKVSLKPNESKEVEILIDKKDLEVYQEGFKLENGKYKIMIGSSSRDIHYMQEIQIKGEKLEDDKLVQYKNINKQFSPTKDDFELLLGSKVPTSPKVRPFTMNSTISELQVTFIGKKIKAMVIKQMEAMFANDTNGSMKRMLESMIDDLPFRGLIMMGQGAISERRAKGLLDLMNKKIFRGIYKVVKG
jgi:beta-glucosidase